MTFKNIEEMRNASYATKSSILDMKIPLPPGKTLFPYQIAAVEFMACNPFMRTLLADEPGLGKTIELIAFINFLKIQNGIIVAPASLLENWKNELESWLWPKKEVRIIDKISKMPLRKGFNLCSYKRITNIINLKTLTLNNWELLALDESHYLKTIKAQRTQAALGKKGLAPKAQHIVAMTGTPIVNRPIEIYPLLKRLCAGAIDNMNKHQFGLKFCDAYIDSMGYWNYNGASNEAELGRRLRSHIMIRREKSQVLKDLPEKRISLAYLCPTSKANKYIIEMKRFDWKEIMKNTKRAEISYEGLSTARHDLGVEKIAPALEYIKTQLISRSKIVVFAHHRAVIEGLNIGLENYCPVVIYGKTPTSDRMSKVKQFQNDSNCRVFIGSIQAAGVGLTLHAASYVIMVEASWVPGENDQAIDRLHRIGQKNAVQADILVFKNSLDENILRAHLKKSKNIKEVLA